MLPAPRWHGAGFRLKDVSRRLRARSTTRLGWLDYSLELSSEISPSWRPKIGWPLTIVVRSHA
jgi:hypothetical protein